MATSLVINGVSYLYPDTGDQSWGSVASAWAAAVTTGMLQKAGGTFALTADANFGTNFGLLSKYFTSITANPAQSGQVRLANLDSVSFRNAANSADLGMSLNASNIFAFSAPISVTGSILSSSTVTGTQLISNIATGTAPFVVASTTQVANLNAATSGITTNIAGGAAGSIPYQTGSGATSFLASGSGVLVGGSTPAYSTSPTLVGTNFSAIPNTALSGITNTQLSGSAGITNANLAAMNANTVKANATGGSATPTDVVMTSAATASAAMIRDGNANVSINNLIENFSTTVTAAGTTTLSVSSSYYQQFTGSTTQIVTLPDCTTLALGQAFNILNRSTGAVAVNNKGGTLVQSVAAGQQCVLTCSSIGSSNGSWDSSLSGGGGTGTVTSVAMTVPAFLSIAGSPVTTSGTLAVSLSGTALPIANGGTAQTSVVSAPAASGWAGWDANKNLSANNHLEGYTTTATAAGTTTLLVGSTFQQYFTGSSTQTVKLPVTSTLVLGQSFQIVNNSTGVVTVQSSGANAITTMLGGTVAIFTCILTSGTTAASWSSSYASSTFKAPTVQKFLTMGATTGYMFTVTSANATVGATYTNNGNTYTVLGTIAAATQLFCSQAAAPLASGTLTKASGTGDATITFSAALPVATYTAPSLPAPLYLKITMVGSGGGGGGAGTAGGSGGTAGGIALFGANLLVANGGSGGGGPASSLTGAGGTASLGTGPIGVALSGGRGENGYLAAFTSGTGTGGTGGNSAFGGGANGGCGGTGNGANDAPDNTGAGGGGGAPTTAAQAYAGAGGGAGGYISAIITSPLTSYPYAVSAGGAGGTGGTSGQAGSAGGSGVIIIEEHYQ